MLELAVMFFITAYSQPWIGLQALVPRFETNEFRHWCIAAPSDPSNMASPKKWRHSYTMKTSKAGPGNTDTEAETCALSSKPPFVANACYDLMDLLIRKSSGPIYEFFQKLIHLGIPAVRIDCGYDFATNKAFLNEFAVPPDSNMWTGLHFFDLAADVADCIGSMLYSEATRDKRNDSLRAPDATIQQSGAAAASAAAAASSSSMS